MFNFLGLSPCYLCSHMIDNVNMGWSNISSSIIINSSYSLFSCCTSSIWSLYIPLSAELILCILIIMWHFAIRNSSQSTILVGWTDTNNYPGRDQCHPLQKNGIYADDLFTIYPFQTHTSTRLQFCFKPSFFTKFIKLQFQFVIYTQAFILHSNIFFYQHITNLLHLLFWK